MNEEQTKKLRLELERMGFDMAKFEKGELEISERTIVEKVLSNETYIKPKIEEAIKKHDGTIAAKMAKEATAMGLDKEKVEAAGGDIKKLFTLVSDFQKEAAGKPDDKKTKELEEWQNKYRQLELDSQAKAKEYEETLTRTKTDFEGAQAKQAMSFAIKSGMMGVGLVDDVAKNLDFYHTALEAKLLSDYEFKNEGGKMLAFKKGGTDKVFVEGKAEQADMQYLIGRTAEELKWKKVTEAKGGGDPGGGGNGGGNPPKPPVHDRYSSALN